MKFNNLFFLFLLLNCYLCAIIINIPADQPTIQAGIDIAVNGDTILVQPGTYFENIVCQEKSLTVASLFYTTQDTSYIAQTIIDGNQDGNVITYYGMIDSTAVLCGFTITNGAGYDGAGIRSHGSSARYLNLVITNNTSFSQGGGMFFECGNPLIENTIITNNSAELDGGGMFFWKQCNPILNNVTISANSADRAGGGILCMEYCDLTLKNSLIFDNTTIGSGGGICNNYYCSIAFENVTIRDNTAFYGGGICSSDLSSLSFDPANRCSIYSNIINNRGYGADIFAYDCDVIVDTFTVLTPTDYYASPIDHFTFDILHEIGNPLINADLYVSVDGDDTNSGITADEPLKTIRCALSKIYADSLNHNTIHLLPGVYSSSTNGESFPIAWSNHVSLEGNMEDNTFLDAENASNVVSFHYVTDALLHNLTIRNGSADKGGGIYCYHSNPGLENVTITGNNAFRYFAKGGGIYCSDSNPSLVDVNIINNHSSQIGGGICCDGYSSPILENVIIKDNSALEKGGGIYCFNHSNPSLENVKIINNTSATEGGGMYCYHSNPCLENVTITGNSATESGGGINCIGNSVPIFSNIDRCNIYLNYAGTNGNDLFSQEPLSIFVDTFTVSQPDDYFAYPIENFTFDILNFIIEPVAQDLFVSPTGSNENSGLTADDPLQTISFALIKITADSINTRTLYISNGTYSPSQTGEKLPINCKSFVSLIGDDQEYTILDGNDLYGVITCSSDSIFSVENMAITNGNRYYGGGVYCVEYSSLNFENVTISNNNAYRAGGIYCIRSSILMQNVNLINNHATYKGGGIYCILYSSLIIHDSNIDENSSIWNPGIYINDNSEAILENLSFTNNTSSCGSVLSCFYSNLELKNAVIKDNDALSGIICNNGYSVIQNVSIEGNYGPGVICGRNSIMDLENVIIAENSSTDIGGGIYCGEDIILNIQNTTITGNSAGGTGAGIYSEYSYETDIQILNSVFWDNSPQEIDVSRTEQVT
jgi:predicted outer membrane repeat protein